MEWKLAGFMLIQAKEDGTYNRSFKSHKHEILNGKRAFDSDTHLMYNQSLDFIWLIRIQETLKLSNFNHSLQNPPE